MGVICFGSLKGGVGKTSLSVNVAHAFAVRGCETLLIDLDPMGHASRFFAVDRTYPVDETADSANAESPLARFFLGGELGKSGEELASVVDAAIASQISLIKPVRQGLTVMPSGPELRHFLWGRGARLFQKLFRRLIDELKSSYDYIVIDTPPDFNVLTRNAIAVSDLVCVPIDSSAMSIHCLEEIVASAAHIKGPTWLIVRTMVNRQALRVHKMSANRLHENLSLQPKPSEIDEEDLEEGSFHSMIESAGSSGKPSRDDSPIYLLNSLIYRSEEQNKLTFSRHTAFDVRRNMALRDQYLGVARELDQMLTFRTAGDYVVGSDEYDPIEVGMMTVGGTADDMPLHARG